jgi:hypothetical protein
MLGDHHQRKTYPSRARPGPDVLRWPAGASAKAVFDHRPATSCRHFSTRPAPYRPTGSRRSMPNRSAARADSAQIDLNTDLGAPETTGRALTDGAYEVLPICRDAQLFDLSGPGETAIRHLRGVSRRAAPGVADRSTTCGAGPGLWPAATGFAPDPSTAPTTDALLKMRKERNGRKRATEKHG